MQIRTQSWAGRIGAIVLFFLCAVAPAHSQSDNEPKGDNVIVIGQSADLSGTYAHLTRQFLLGANVYFAQLNTKGGVHGRRIRLLTMDDKNEPELALKNTQRLVHEQKVLALFGYTGAQTTTAVLPVINEQKIPYFAPVTGSKVAYIPFNRYVFTIRASYIDEYQYLFPRLSQIGLKRLAIFNDTAGLPHRALMQTLISDANGHLVAFETGLGTGIEKIADNLLQSRPDIIMFMSISHDINSALIKSLRAKGYLGYFYCNSLVCSPILTSELQQEASGAIITQIVPFPWKAATPIVNEYQKSMKKAGIKKFNHHSLEGYIAAKVLAEGLNRAGPKITREKLIAALESVNEKNYDNFGFHINFSSINHHGSKFVDLTTVDKTGNILN